MNLKRIFVSILFVLLSFTNVYADRITDYDSLGVSGFSYNDIFPFVDVSEANPSDQTKIATFENFQQWTTGKNIIPIGRYSGDLDAAVAALDVAGNSGEDFVIVIDQATSMSEAVDLSSLSNAASITLAFLNPAGVITTDSNTLTLAQQIPISVDWQIFDAAAGEVVLTGEALAEWWGAVGDGATDDTDPIQYALDSGAKAVKLLNKKYLVSKTSNFSAYFPGSDQPCILIYDKDNFKFYGSGSSELYSAVHAQGILEVQLSTHITIEGIKFTGAADFPDLDGTTGRAEKGVADAGYYTSGYWGYYKNNSCDTSASSTGGFGGAFPQWGGGTAATWGTWEGGGYIGNVSFGVLIHNGCDDVKVQDCEVTGFNYVGIGVGFLGDYWPTDRSYDDSTNIKFLHCDGYSNYSSNFSSYAVDGFELSNCSTSYAGHPDADLVNDDNVDPGYGYAARSGHYSITKNAIISNNTVSYNNRKGLDSHGHSRLSFIGNTVKESAVCGIYASALSSGTNDTIISGNIIANCGWTDANAVGGIYAAGYPSSIDTNIVISNNILRECGSAKQISLQYATNGVITGNTVFDCDARNTTNSIVIYTRYIDALTVCDNIIDANANTTMTVGIQAGAGIDSGSIANNNIKLYHASAIRGIYVSYTAPYRAPLDVYENRVILDTAGIAYDIRAVTGSCANNYYTGGSSIPYLYPKVQNIDNFRVPNIIALTITFNDTASPTYNVTSGARYVDGAIIGTQTAASDTNDPDVLTDSTKTWTVDALVGETIYNVTDGSSGVIISNTANTITATLSGGSDNSWDIGDVYHIFTPSIYSTATGFGIKLHNLTTEANFDSTVTMLSAGGLPTAASKVGYIYEHSTSSTWVYIGLKVSDDGADIPAEDVTGGSLRVTILVY